MDLLNDIFNQVLGLGHEALTALMVIIFGYGLRVARWFPNRYIPLAAVVMGGVIYWLLVPTPAPDPKVHFPAVRLVMIGALIGFLGWVGHNKFLKRLEDKIPFIKDWLHDQDDDFPENPPGASKTTP